MPPIAIQELKHDLIEPDPRNPRQICGEEQLVELGTDIALRGILQPIVVRKHPESAGRYMIVFGERRWRAAGMVDCATVPCIVRQYDSELAVLEDQIAENGKRADVHPLEEADAYRRLHEEHGRDVDEIAELTGKSRAYVYAAMKLCALTGEARRAFLTGKSDKSVALLLARLPSSQQAEAWKQLQQRSGEDGPSYRDAQWWLRQRFMLRLVDAPFRIDDAELVPKAGPCTTCPKRTGNQRELFADVVSEKDGADVCTDPACHQAKRDAQWARQKVEAETAGKVVLEGKKATEATSYSNKEYVDLNASAGALGGYNKTYGQLLGKSAAAAVTAIARDDRGEVHELIPKAALKKLVKEKKIEKPAAFSGPTKQDREERKATEELEQAVLGRVREALVEKAAELGELDLLRLLVRMAIRSRSFQLDLGKVAKRHCSTLVEQLATDQKGDMPDDVRLFRFTDRCEDAATLRSILFEVLLGRADYYELEDTGRPKMHDADVDDWRAQEQSNLLDAVEVAGVDVKAIEKQAEKEQVAAAKAAEQAKTDKKTKTTDAPSKPKKKHANGVAAPATEAAT